jgi:hypothetical protein
MPKPTAQVVSETAQRLAARFLEAGNYVFAEPMSARALAHVMPAATIEVSESGLEQVGFAGLAIQAVGYEAGARAPKIHIYVTKGRHLERQFENVDVEVHRVGRVTVRPEAASAATHRGNLFQRKGRIACGSSCAPSGEQYAGTLGALLRRSNDRTLYALSNNHVFAAGNHTPVGMPILSPSSIDASPSGRAPGEVCRHAEICELRSGVPTLVPPGREDVAIAQVPNPNVVSSWQGEGAGSFDTPTVVVAPRAGLRVKKIGRTSALTIGSVEALINSPLAVPYKCRHFAATVWLQDVWTVRGDAGGVFALPGDSGSLVVTEDSKSAVGLVFAASVPSGDLGYVIPMDHIKTLFGGLTLVGNHGT